MKNFKKLILKYFVYFPQAIIVSPIFVLIMILFFPILKIRINRIIGHRLGHFAANTDIYLTNKNNSIYRNLDVNFFISKPCNAQLHKMWKRRITVLPHFLVYPHYKVLKFLSKYFSLAKAFLVENNERDYEGFINNTEPNLNFSTNELKKGEEFLKQFNLKLDSKFVCLTIRDKNYLQKKFPNQNWDYHSYRNMNLKNFIKAINYLNEQGIMVFKMGYFSDEKTKINNKLFFDYSNSEFKSEFLDIFLGANCYFCISTDTGFDQIPFIFRRPVAYITDPIGSLKTFNKRSMSIFSHYYFSPKNKKLSLREIFDKNISIFNKTSEIKNAEIDLLKPNEEEIESFVKDFKIYLENNFDFTNSDDKLINKMFFDIFKTEVSKNKFVELLKEKRKIAKYHNHYEGSVSPSFLRLNRYLLEP